MEIKQIPNQIIKEPLQSVPLTNFTDIALHHMAHNTADVKEVEQWHINKGWRAIGYGFWISFNGTIFRGRGLNQNAGVENQNGHILSIGFQGDYHNTPGDMPMAQFNAGIELINYLRPQLPNLARIEGHGHFMATVCPGKYFPLAEMKSRIKRSFNDMAKIVIKGSGKDVTAFADGKNINSDGLIEMNGTTSCENLAVLLRDIGHEVEWQAK